LVKFPKSFTVLILLLKTNPPPLGFCPNAKLSLRDSNNWYQSLLW